MVLLCGRGPMRFLGANDTPRFKSVNRKDVGATGSQFFALLLES